MSLRTPTQASAEKKVHTPPSIERDPGKPKLLKSLSGRVFKRSSNSDNETLASTGLFVPAPSLSNRYPLPKPLNIPQPLSPPPSVKKAYHWSPGTSSRLPHNDVLESPIQLAPSLKVQSLEKPLDSFNLTCAFNSGSRSEPRTEVSPHDNTIIWTDTVDDPYLEEDSPTYLRSISQNIFNVNAAKAGHRRFVGVQCSMCDEKICNVLSGEKIVELTCSHASHYQCYLATLECLHASKKYPQCRMCGKVAKPTDKNILEKMVTHLLSRRSSTDHSQTMIEPQWLQFKPPGTASRHAYFTPGEQVIRTADVSSSGFRTPFALMRSASDGAWNSCNEPNDNLFQKSTWLEQTLLNIIDDDEEHSEAYEGEEAGVFKSDSQIEVTANCNKSQHSLTLRIPKDFGQEGPQEKECDELAGRRLKLIQEVEASIKEGVDTDDNLGPLVMFDKVNFSTDGEKWNKNVMLYLFDRFFVLFDRLEMTTRGKIPLEQICQVLKLDDATLLIDLKSRTLPQVYISIPSKNPKNPPLEKWKFYLHRNGSHPSLEEITSNSWKILPQELVKDLNDFFALTNKGVADTDMLLFKPWETIYTHVPLQLIICLSLSNDTAMDNKQYQDCITSSLRSLLNCLNDRDLLGLVAVGKDGRGNVGKFGTFVGTINKHWPHWDDALGSLEPVKYNVFDTAESELDKMLETCLRLVSTAESMLEEGQSGHFSKQVILLRNGTPPKCDHKYGRLISDVHGFNTTQISSINALDPGELDSVISTLHRSYFKDLKVTLANEELSFGSMAPGQEKTIPLAWTPRSNSCKISWSDFRTQHTVTVTKSIAPDQ